MPVVLGEVVQDEYLMAKAKELYDENYSLNPPELQPCFQSQPLETRAWWFAKAARLPVSDSGFEAESAKAKELYEAEFGSNPPGPRWKSLPLAARVEWLNKAVRKIVADQMSARETAPTQKGSQS